MSLLYAHNDTKALFAAVAQGNETAFESLFIQYRSKLYAVAFKWTKSAYAAEEIMQDVFISVWTSREQLLSVNDPQAYIYTIMYNKVKRYLKNENNRDRILKLSVWNKKTYSNETEEKVYANDSQKFINNAIAQLSPQKKLIYLLNRQQGKTYDEIAQILHLSRNTVKSHLIKAVKFIRDHVKENALLIVWLLTWLCR